MHRFWRSDAQLQQVGCTTLVGNFVILINVAASLGPLAAVLAAHMCGQDSCCIILCMRPTKYVHATYKSCASDLQNFASDIQKLCIQPKQVVHPTYKTCVSDLLLQLCIRSTKICVSDLRKLCIRPTCATGTSILMVALPTTYNGYICIMQFLLGRINKIECTFDLQLSQVRSIVGRKRCRTEVTYTCIKSLK